VFSLIVDRVEKGQLYHYVVVQNYKIKDIYLHTALTSHISLLFSFSEQRDLDETELQESSWRK